ncbi:MAG: lipoyl synthase [Candidatus Margulisbacteria bacterium]|jgi:lipoic acid synthetase|nr:lipoyl synthase [Candidatus Margulisiibacteriota bacterium]
MDFFWWFVKLVSMRYPVWLKKNIPKSAPNLRIRGYFDETVHTVCESALCPNRGECFAARTVTFLILGAACTRRCRFCAVRQAAPEPVDADEPRKIAAAARKLGLRYVVITSVTRDDLPDGGAAHFAAAILAARQELPRAAVEVLTPDFQGDLTALDTVLAARPAVYNHNIETVPRLYAAVRPRADYRRSLKILDHAARTGLPVKSGLMLGLGETETEIKLTLRDLKNAGVSIVTLGQYLPPSKKHYPVQDFIRPGKFTEYKTYGEKELGFRTVFAGPLVRSSYRAGEILEEAENITRFAKNIHC